MLLTLVTANIIYDVDTKHLRIIIIYRWTRKTYTENYRTKQQFPSLTADKLGRTVWTIYRHGRFILAYFTLKIEKRFCNKPFRSLWKIRFFPQSSTGYSMFNLYVLMSVLQRPNGTKFLIKLFAHFHLKVIHMIHIFMGRVMQVKACTYRFHIKTPALCTLYENTPPKTITLDSANKQANKNLRLNHSPNRLNKISKYFTVQSMSECVQSAFLRRYWCSIRGLSGSQHPVALLPFVSRKRRHNQKCSVSAVYIFIYVN